MICVKVHSNELGSVFAACDEELVGKTFESDGRKIVISEEFYKEETITEEEFAKRIHYYDNINMMGEKTIAVAIKEELVSEEYVITVAGVKHVQVVK